MTRSEVTQESQECRVGSADAAGTLDGLDDDRGQVFFLAAEEHSFHALGVAPWQHGRPVSERSAGTPGVPAIATSWVPWYARSNLATSSRR